MDFLQIAKAFLPQNSPLMQRVEMAQNLIQQFQPNKTGVVDLMKQNGKSVNDLQSAVNNLNNPIIAGFLEKIMPGITNSLRQAGQSLIQEMSSSTSPTSQNQFSGSIPADSNKSVSSFQDRLNALK